MKRQLLRYRTFTIAVGIVVALLIVITLWTTRSDDAPAAMDNGKETSFVLKPLIHLQPVIEILK
jgi:hypothetical protein